MLDKKTSRLASAPPPEKRSELSMNDQSFDLTQQMLAAVKDARVPDGIQQLSLDSVSKTRDLYRQINAAAIEQVKVLGDVMQTSQAGFKSLSEKMAADAATNTEAAFAAAQAIARAKTVPEAARLQAEFLQQQFATASAQARELFDLSVSVSQRTFAAINTAATRSIDTFKAAP